MILEDSARRLVDEGDKYVSVSVGPQTKGVWEPDQHPRDEAGRFGDKDTGGNMSGGGREPSKSAKAILAAQTSRYVGAEVQRYSEEHNEPIVAQKLGGKSLDDNEPVDVLVENHGIEVKT